MIGGATAVIDLSLERQHSANTQRAIDLSIKPYEEKKDYDIMSLSSDIKSLILQKQKILFLTLDPRLNDSVITRHIDLPHSSRTYCKNFTTYEENFGFDRNIIDILESHGDNTIAHLVIVTHGNIYRLYIGKDSKEQNIIQNTELFNRFAEILNRKLLPKASILITACLTGKIHHEKINTPDILEYHINCKYGNWSNNLSNLLPYHRIFCTPDEQIQNELILHSEISEDDELCNITNKSDPVSFIYYSTRQITYAYVYKPDIASEGCQVLPTNI